MKRREALKKIGKIAYAAPMTVALATAERATACSLAQEDEPCGCDKDKGGKKPENKLNKKGAKCGKKQKKT